MRPLLPLPAELGVFERTHLTCLDPESRKEGHAAAYFAESFSAVVSVWRHADPDISIADGIGEVVLRQFKTDLRHVAEQEAVSAPVLRTTLLASEDTGVPMLEARYFIDGVDDGPAFATLAAFAVQGAYVSIAT